MYIRTLLITLVIALSACSTSLKRIAPDDKIEKNHGIVLTRILTNYFLSVSFKSASGEEYRLWGFKENNEKFVVGSLPAGKYSIFRMEWDGRTAKYIDNSPYQFEIKKGSVNYICDLNFYFTYPGTDILGFDRGPSSPNILPIDKKQISYKEFKNNYPDISKKYPLISAPISMCVSDSSKQAQKFISNFKYKKE